MFQDVSWGEMMKFKLSVGTFAVMTAFLALPLHAEDKLADAKPDQAEAKNTTEKADKVTVTGILPSNLEAVPGSFTEITKEELEVKRPFSVQEALVNVPGVNIVGENSFGLGLNIGMRGLDPRRTSRTLLMEDGVPLFLAPYGDPSAHFTTPIERVERIEVVKGSGQILYGPQTIGGMINFVTKPVPKDGFAGSVSLMGGTDDFRGGHVNLGVGDERGGIMIDANQKTGDGIRKNHDFDVRDITVKGQLNINDKNTLIAKVGYYEENSNITETGLGLLEYRQDKFQAPTGKNDKFELERKSASLQHIFEMSDKAKLTTTAYYSDIFRSSFRQINAPGFSAAATDDAAVIGQGDVDFSGVEEDDPSTATGFSAIERCPLGVDNANFANANNCGGRHRPRSMKFFGFEPRLDFKHKLFGIDSDAVVGFRYHEEDQRRRQFRDFDPRSQSLSFIKTRVLAREDLRIDTTAMSYYAQNTFYVNNWTFTPGVRVEDIRTTTDIVRADNDPQDLRGTRSQTEVLPGFGTTWNGIQNTTLFAGVHRGLAPPRASRDLGGINDVVRLPNTKPETSTNWEVGARSRYFKGTSFESTLFHTKVDDVVVQDNGRFFNGGKSTQSGVEFAGRVDFGEIMNTPHNFYLLGNYTNLFRAKFTADVASEGIESGNRLPYAPKNIASVSLGYQHPIGIDARVGANYVDEQFVDGANTRDENLDLSGRSGKIDAYTLLNASVNFKPVGTKTTYFLSGYNLADREYLATRVDGMAVGRGRMVFGGLRYDF
jgi:Fe(3+) dicitrate transport protein